MIILGFIILIIVIALDIYLAMLITKYFKYKFDNYSDSVFPLALAIIFLLEVAIIIQWFYNTGNFIG